MENCENCTDECNLSREAKCQKILLAGNKELAHRHHVEVT